MPRKAREKSGTGIYHVMLRGINHQDIFEERSDYWKFLSTQKEPSLLCTENLKEAMDKAQAMMAEPIPYKDLTMTKVYYDDVRMNGQEFVAR